MSQNEIDRKVDDLIRQGAANRILRTGIGNINDMLDLDSSLTGVVLTIVETRAQNEGGKILSHTIRTSQQRAFDNIFARARNTLR